MADLRALRCRSALLRTRLVISIHRLRAAAARPLSIWILAVGAV
jgi:hypothetical protein